MLFSYWLKRSAQPSRQVRRWNSRQGSLTRRSASYIQFARTSMRMGPERLENRQMLAAAALSSGNLIITGTTSLNEGVTISNDGTTITINDPVNPLIAGTGVTVVNANTVSFAAASLTGSLQVDLDEGTDSVTFTGSTFSARGGFDLHAETITVSANTTLSTRVTSGDLLTGASTANSGNISLAGSTITLANGSRLLAHVLMTDSFNAGGVSIAADNTADREYAGISGFTTQDATVTLTGATVRGGAVEISSTASDIQSTAEVPDFVQGFLSPIKTLIEKIPGVTVPNFNGLSTSIVQRGAKAFVTVTDATINGDSVSVMAISTADNDINATAVSSPKVHLGIAIGYAEATARAETTLAGTTNITAKNDLLVSTNATAKAGVTAKSEANLDESSDNTDTKANAVALAITSTDLDSIATVGLNVVLSSLLGNVNVLSDGKVTSTPKAEGATYKDGLSGITVGLGFDKSDVTATVNGTVTAKGVERALVFNPTGGGIVDLAANTLRIPGHGLTTGDELTYRNGGGSDIAGLKDGDSFHVIVIDADRVQLAKSPVLDLGLSGINPASTQTLTKFASRDFQPANSGVVNADTDTLTINAHGLTNGTEVIYSANGSNPIPGLKPGTIYVVESATTNTLKLRRLDNGQLADLRVDSDSPVDGDHTLLFEGAALSFVPNSALNETTDAISLPGHGLTTGDAVAYRVDPTRTQRIVDGGRTVSRPDPEIQGLESGGTYFAVVIDANTVRLAKSASLARAASPVDLTSVGTGTQHKLDAGFTRGIGVHARLAATNQVMTTSAIGGEPPAMMEEAEGTTTDSNPGEYSDLLDFDPMSFIEDVEDDEAAARGETEDSDTKKATKSSEPDKLNVAASVGINFVDHDVRAVVGATADLNSEADVVVAAKITETSQVQVQAESSKAEDSGGATVSAAAGVGLGFYNNDARAEVLGGARIDAHDTITVNATVEYPFLVPEKETLNPGDLFAGNRPTIKEVFQGKLDFSTEIVNTFVFTKQENAEGKVSIAGAVGFTDYNNVALAAIRNGALINQDTSATFRNVAQAVEVTAATELQLINMAGLGELNLTREGVKKLVKER